jgi:hypothetical protein
MQNNWDIHGRCCCVIVLTINTKAVAKTTLLKHVCLQFQTVACVDSRFIKENSTVEYHRIMQIHCNITSQLKFQLTLQPCG